MSKGYKLVKIKEIKNLGRRHPGYKLAKQYDAIGYISDELGKEIERIWDEDYIIGIHRTGDTPVTEHLLLDVFNNGLINNGHVMQGAKDNCVSIERTVSLFKNMTVFIGQLKAAKGYRNSDGSIIVKIPKSYLGMSDGEVKPIYFNNNGQIRLLPEFIYGYVPVDDKYNCGDIVRNPNYTDTHEYENEGLIYDTDANLTSYKMN